MRCSGMLLAATLLFACTPIEATSAISILCEGGRRVTLANIRAAASSEKMRQTQRASLRQLAVGRSFQCRHVGERGEIALAECRSGAGDLATLQIDSGHARAWPAPHATR